MKQPITLLMLLWALVSGVATAAPAQAEKAPSDERHYTLDAGDAVRIHVFGEDDLSIDTTLGQTGQINYPYLGTITAAGMTVEQLEHFIADGLRGDYLVSPSVNVSIIQYRQFYIYGEVKSPGGYPYQPNLTIERAVALAGGFTQRASRDKIQINRTTKGKEGTVAANMSTLVRPGDSIQIQDSFF